MTKFCNICGTTLNSMFDILTKDCGGDCAKCMIEAGDYEVAFSIVSSLQKEIALLEEKRALHWQALCMIADYFKDHPESNVDTIRKYIDELFDWSTERF